MGAFPVNRDVVDREALKTAAEVLDRGEPLVLFPEGSRKSGPRVENLHEGAVYLAMKAGVPIVPVGLGNTEKASPKGKFFARPVKIRMIVGEPITYDAPAGDGQSKRIPRTAITEMTQLLQHRLQALYDESLGLDTKTSAGTA
jgi:1-acyl-sn-glycerol-3-phosphate acyltransferase